MNNLKNQSNLAESTVIAPEVESKKTNFFTKFKTAYGPGILAVLTWLGAGDLVTSSVAGADYGYSLMWILALSLILRFLIVNVIARFQLCNTEGLTILEGYGRIHPFFGYFMFGYALIMGHLFNAYMIKGAGEVLSTLFHVNQPFLASMVVVGLVFMLIGRNIYNRIESVMKVLLALLTIAFLFLAIQATPDVGQIIKGTVGFSIPSDTGVHGALLVAISIIGAVAGSISNFVHPYFMKEKGWTKPSHVKVQRNDLLFAIGVCIVINLAIWVVGAEILKPNGIHVETIDDLAMALQMSLGQFGWYIFYLGVFGVLFASIVGKSTGFPRLIVDAFYVINKNRREKYNGKYEKDPMFKWIMIFVLVTPLIWSIPGMPGFIALTIGVNAINIIGFPVIAIGMLVLSNKKSLMGKYKNNWFENIILTLASVLAIWSAVQLATTFF
ncbi:MULTISPECIES: Nramp family divalent metal transporter [Peribacillus]|uniref:Nramp family divalent metal transporter n=2 Tax=Bacillales TaxID=1385 RepID=UPI00201BBF05|nr:MULTISPECIES: Nramp family divalent metal transporter [Peribacillus]MCZ0874117.1 Nramp family divalent metal transporter [Peribacillus sp. AS_2]MED3995572.1 Nramp family divalent metal transporter [Peribacillus frigoritolerans]